MAPEAGRVLVAGIYLTDRENTAAATIAELTRSQEWSVTHRWAALGQQPPPNDLARVTAEHIQTAMPKFVLLNHLLTGVNPGDYRFVIFADDDIDLPSGFLDDYLRLVNRYDFALSQPARTHDSFIDHRFVERLDGIDARWTNFVEIGPLVTMRHDAASILLPFDEMSPMGWGYDFTWPRTMQDAGLRLGIVDATPVRHSLRKPVTGYSWDTANDQQQKYMASRPHLSKLDAFRILESYA